MGSSEKKPSQDLQNFIWGRKNATERHGPEYLRTAVTLNPGTALISFIWDKLRTTERKYQEQRRSAPTEFNQALSRKWFWIILTSGLVLPFTSLIGLKIRHANEVSISGLFSNLFTLILGMSILFVAPFLAYAIHSANRLRGDRSQIRPVVGGFIGLSAVYAFFYAIFLPWGISLGSSDNAGMVEAMVIYFLFVAPFLALCAIVLGRKLAPPHLSVWPGGQNYDTAKTESQGSDSTTLLDG